MRRTVSGAVNNTLTIANPTANCLPQIALGPAAHAAGYLAGIAVTAMIGGPGGNSFSHIDRTFRAGAAPISALGA